MVRICNMRWQKISSSDKVVFISKPQWLWFLIHVNISVTITWTIQSVRRLHSFVLIVIQFDYGLTACFAASILIRCFRLLLLLPSGMFCGDCRCLTMNQVDLSALEVDRKHYCKIVSWFPIQTLTLNFFFIDGPCLLHTVSGGPFSQVIYLYLHMYL